MNDMQARTLITLVILCILLTGCDLEGWLRIGTPNEGRLVLGVTDAPADQAAEVWVTFTGVAFQSDDGKWTRITLDRPQPVDLLALQGERELLLDRIPLEAQRYRFVQLLIDTATSYVVSPTGGEHPLQLQEDLLFGTSAGFTMPDHGALDLTLDIDLRRGLDGAVEADRFWLRPAMRLIRTEDSGHITGSVSQVTLDSGVGCADRAGYSIYVFAGRNTAPREMHGDGIGPLTSSRLREDNTYTVAYLPAGQYTLAFTCQGARDHPLTDDRIGFSQTINATVTAGKTTAADFMR